VYKRHIKEKKATEFVSEFTLRARLFEDWTLPHSSLPHSHTSLNFDALTYLAVYDTHTHTHTHTQR